MPKAFVCEACGGRQADKNRAGLLVCAYCGSTHLLPESSIDEQAEPNRRPKWFLWGVPLVVLFAVIWYRVPSQKTTPQERISQSPSTIKTPVVNAQTTQKPAAEALPATVTMGVLSSQTAKTTSGGQYWVFQIKNTSDHMVYRPRVVVSLFDAADARVAEQSGWTHRSVMAPGAEETVMVYMKELPQDSSRQEILAMGDTSTFLEPNQQSLKVSDYQVKPQRNRFELVGDVTNPHDHTLRFIKVVAVAKNAAGQPVGVANAYATQKELAPGASSGFKVSAGTFMTEAPSDWSVFAIGSVKPTAE